MTKGVQMCIFLEITAKSIDFTIEIRYNIAIVCQNEIYF